MDAFLFILEIAIYTLDAMGIGVDIYSWIRGKDNRRERKLAKSTGSDIPPRDKWNRLVVVCTIAVVVLTVALALWKL